MNETSDQALRKLYRASRTEQPSDLCDQRILRAAQQVAKSKQRQHRQRRIWALSSVAVIMLSLNIVLQLFDQAPEPVEMYAPASNAPVPVLKSPPPILAESADAIDAERDLIMPAPETARAGQIRKRLKAEQMAQMTMKKALPAVVIPALPADLEQLVERYPELKIEQVSDKNKVVSLNDQRILQRLERGASFEYQAWRGAEKLGVIVNWHLARNRLDDCKSLDDFEVCDLKSGVEGFFRAGRLDHIRWRVRHD